LGARLWTCPFFLARDRQAGAEFTFRAIGEGTNNFPLMLDKFDSYYRHLFLWDDEEKVIVGAYPNGMVPKYLRNTVIDGFYLQDLFRF